MVSGARSGKVLATTGLKFHHKPDLQQWGILVIFIYCLIGVWDLPPVECGDPVYVQVPLRINI